MDSPFIPLILYPSRSDLRLNLFSSSPMNLAGWSESYTRSPQSAWPPTFI